MEFYKIELPSTEQIFNAIIDNEYTPLDKIQPKAKQLKVLLMDYFCSNEIFITFDGVTNAGGLPIFLSSNESMYEIASNINEDFYNLSEEEQDSEIELLWAYIRPYNEVFSL